MWTYWGSKIDKKSDSMDAYWGSFLSVWEVLSPVFFTLVQIFFWQSHVIDLLLYLLIICLTSNLKITCSDLYQIKSLKMIYADK